MRLLSLLCAHDPRRTALIIPFRDREHHLEFFRTHFSSFVKQDGGKCVSSWHVIIVEQFDDALFNRGQLFNVGFSLVKKPEYDVNAECLQIQDVDEVPIGPVDLGDCDTPVQTSSEIPRFSNSVPYLESAGANVMMNQRDWEQINCFSNKYEGWGGEDDDLFERLKAHELLFGDCFPFCKENDPRINSTQISLRRPKKGRGRVVDAKGKHTPRVTESAGTRFAILSKAKEDLKKNKSCVYNNGCSNVQFSLVASRTFRDGDIRYHHVRVRGSPLDIPKVPLLLPRTGGGRPVAVPLNTSWPVLQDLDDQAQKRNLSHSEGWEWKHNSWFGLYRQTNASLRLETDHDVVAFVRSLKRWSDGAFVPGDDSAPFVFFSA